MDKGIPFGLYAESEDNYQRKLSNVRCITRECIGSTFVSSACKLHLKVH